MKLEDWDLQSILELYYKAEQNVKISCFWDGGWDVWIGDDVNSYKDQDCMLSLNEVKGFLLVWYQMNIGRLNETGRT